MAISISLYLDCRHNSSNSSNTTTKNETEFPVKIAINKGGSSAYIPTGIKISATNWKNQKVTGRPDKARLNTHLESLKSEVMNLVLEKSAKGLYSELTATEIKNDISRILNKTEEPKNYFLAFYDVFAEKRESKRTKEIYRATAKKIRALIPRADAIPIERIDLAWLEKYNDILVQKGNNGSTRSIDFRNIRAVLKYAQKRKLIHDNPFDDFKIPAGESPNRALTIEQLKMLKAAKVQPWEQKYLDFFFLSFLLIGINTEDLLHIERIEDGRINYVRAKTGQPMSIKVEPEALEIINRYRGKKYLLDMLDTYSTTHNWTSKVDNALKKISNNCGIPEISMYWARHTWATLANVDLGIELSTVSDALGHQPEKKVTLIYIKRKDYTRVDEANRKVIDYLFE